MRPQEMGQREASGRRQREVHPQQLHGGSVWGAAAEALPRGPLASRGCLCQCLESGNGSPRTLYTVSLIFLLIVKL